QLSPPGVPQSVRLRHHAALYAGLAQLVAQAHGERSMTKRPLRSLLLQGASAALLSLSGLVLAAPQHALTLYGEAPKYPANFKQFDYVNPDAPKGGILRQAGFGSFDSLNPYISKGVAADEIGQVYDTLTRHGLDEPFTEYGLLAETI